MSEHKTFEAWFKKRDPELHEVATTTADIAQFRRMVIPSVRRGKLDTVLGFGHDDFFDKKGQDKTEE